MRFQKALRIIFNELLVIILVNQQIQFYSIVLKTVVRRRRSIFCLLYN